MKNKDWYSLRDPSATITPSLLIYPTRILHNIRTMVEMAGGAKKLRPHIKTHKTAEIIEMQLENGIHKFKCATIAEAELLGRCNATDILLAMQPVGVDMSRFFQLMETYPESKFSALVDNLDTLEALSEMAKSEGVVVSLWMDINSGMDRTGIVPGAKAITLYRQMDADINVEARGFHVYDGHFRNTDVGERKKACDQAFKSILNLKSSIESSGSAVNEKPIKEIEETNAKVKGIDIEPKDIKVAGIVAGGSPTFPFHAKRNGVEASPGTTLLWDAGYSRLFPEMEFLPAAVLMARIISKPSNNILCLDLGHKHLASEMPFPRVRFLNIGNCIQKGQSEEHFVLECENAEDYSVGDILYAVPVHICPTVAKYESLQVVSEGRIIDEWKVAARDKRITI